ncbi:lipid storage droplets surface-binding protein 2-like isoform X2 [Periplaneta americana]|uniref:lipid storage droplets surface-binding protein 2-like isoform X2 n=1 Tax=Periplaneta americana TaxID=6978 RepID=UPI0037E8F0C2
MEPTATAAENSNASMPHLECVDMISKIPFFEMAWNQSAGMYGKVKEANAVFNWTLSTAESAVLKAVEQAAPIAKKLEQPIHAVDQTLCKGIAIVEEKLPLVKEPPSHIYETAKTFVNSALTSPMDTVSAVKNYGAEKAHCLKEASLLKANEVLATRYGNMALSGFETTAALAEKYLDYYFPATEQEIAQDEGLPAEVESEDKVLNTVHTVGRLSNKFARRVYNILSSQVKNLNKDNMQQYVNTLATIMHLTNHLSTINQNLKATTGSSETKTEDTSKKQDEKSKAT